jgi:selenocysteine lyase/cysteine desulfurase
LLTENALKQLRSRFPVFRDKVYLNSCSQGALSDAVEEGFREYLEIWHRHGSPWDLWVEEYEKIRAQFAAFIGAMPEEIAILPYASAGICSIASACDFSERPKVVLGKFEFPTMGHAWLAQQERGAQVEFVRAEGEAIPFSSYECSIDRRTRIAAVTHVCFNNGHRSPVREIVDKAHQEGAWVLMDDYQDCGTRPVNVRSLEVDFYVTGTLKYLLGPPGLAFLYVRNELHDALTPTMTGWFAQRQPFAFDVEHLDRAPSARKFEGGSPPIPNIYAASRGLRLIGDAGRDVIADHVASLTQYLLEGLAAQGVSLKTPGATVGPLVVIRCREAAKACALFAKQGIVLSSRYDGLRVSLHLYNTREDVDALLQEIDRSRALFEELSATQDAEVELNVTRDS